LRIGLDLAMKLEVLEGWKRTIEQVGAQMHLLSSAANLTLNRPQPQAGGSSRSRAYV
jgi:hypothetical protein